MSERHFQIYIEELESEISNLRQKSQGEIEAYCRKIQMLEKKIEELERVLKTVSECPENNCHYCKDLGFKILGIK